MRQAQNYADRCAGRLAPRGVKADQRTSDRARKIANGLHDKWGGATEDEYEFPPKPPRMRWATYNRLEAQYDDLENRWPWASWPGSLGSTAPGSAATGTAPGTPPATTGERPGTQGNVPATTPGGPAATESSGPDPSRPRTLTSPDKQDPSPK